MQCILDIRRHDMQLCKTCGAVLPAHARFCGRCGRAVNMTVKISTSINALLAGALSSADALTGIRRLSPPGQYTPEQGREDPNRTNQYKRFEKEDQKLKPWADMPVPPLLSSFAGEAQASGANGPKVQRIP